MNQGRKPEYTQEVADEICDRLAEGESLRTICADDHLPSRSTIMLWAAKDRRLKAEGKESPYHGFSDQYELACEARMLYHADELLDIADDSTNDYMEKTNNDGSTYEALNAENIQRSRLRVDTRKWLLSKMLPRYADKQAVEHTSPDGSMSPTRIEITSPDSNDDG